MTLSFDRWVSEDVKDRDLAGYARERAVEELRDDETLEALWTAGRAADDRQSALYQAADGIPVRDDLRDTLIQTRRTCDDALDPLADRIVREAVTDVDVFGWTVDLRHATRLDCPDCREEDVEAYHLGSYDGGVGWVCGHCGATAVEDPETGDVKRADGGDVEDVEAEGSA